MQTKADDRRRRRVFAEWAFAVVALVLMVTAAQAQDDS